jgi:ribonucleoside-diphosphate reductase alpha chain
MRVVKRNGVVENVSFDKVLQRIRRSARGLAVHPDGLAQQVLSQIYDGVKTTELDDLTAQLAASLSTTHPDWGTLASRIAISNHHKQTPASFSAAMLTLGNQVSSKTGEAICAVSAEILFLCRDPETAARIDAAIRHERDYELDYFGFKTLERSYLLKDVGLKIVERPQHLWMRVALALWAADLDRAFETYDLLSTKKFTHATPTLFSAGTPRQQLSSCFVAGTPVHTMDGVKAIEEVQIGDQVVTHTGSVKKVSQLHKNLLGDRQLFTLKVAGTPAFTVTGNHRLWSLSEEQDEWDLSAGWNRVDYLRTGDWIAIPGKKHSGEDFILDVKDYLDSIEGDGDNVSYNFEYTDTQVIPSYTYVTHRSTGDVLCTKAGGSFNRYWKFDTKMMELLGIWYGDGCVVHAKNSSGNMHPRAINIVAYHTNSVLTEFVVNQMTESFGVEHITVSTDDNGMVSMNINNTVIAALFKAIFKCGFGGKALPAFFNTMSHEHIRYFLAGLVSSDGCVSKENNVTIQLTNPPLVTGIFHLARSVGIPLTMTMMHTGDKKPTGRINVPHPIVYGLLKKHYDDERLANPMKMSKQWNQVRVINGTTFMRLSAKDICVGKPEFVYTLGIDDDHSYSVGGIIAENCFLLAMDSDSIGGIFKTLSDCAAISKHAGGIGLHVSNIRARGSGIRGTNGTTDGIMPMLRVFNNTARYVNQGSRRNGSFAIYLEPWHADVEDFLKLKLNSGAEEERARDLFYALWVPDLFMERVEKNAEWSLFCPDEAPGLADVWGRDFVELYLRYEREGRAKKTVSAQKLWFQILDTQMETGTPYLLYKDAANAKSNQQNLGTIKSSNLCVAPETYILTDQGQFQIHELEGMDVNVWNGDKWSQTTVRKTGTQQRLLTVTLSNGADIHCTPYHKFLVRDGYTDKGSLKDATRIDASDLKEGMKLAKCDLGLVEGNPDEDIPHPYTHGFFCGDGTVNTCNKTPTKLCCLYGEKKKLLDKLAIKSTSGVEDSSGRINTTLDQSISEKFYVPMNASLKCRLEWLAGLLDADGCVVANGDNESLQLASTEYEFLDRIRLMVQTLGVQSKVIKLHDARQTMMPDGKGGRKLFDCKPIWRILISSTGLYRLKNLGLTCHRLVFEGKKPQRNAEQFVTVVSVVDDGRVDDTYCFNEPENHAGIFNGVLTGNCSEIIEYSSADETAVCNLASLSLPAFVSKGEFDFAELRRVVRVAIRNLNRVIDINYYPTPETRRSNLRHRPVGLGVQGLADVFAALRLSWESAAAADLNQRIFEHIYYAAVAASAELAETEGTYDTFAGSPASQGRLQPDLWISAATSGAPLTEADGSLDWPALRQAAARGLRNSLLTAPMPTASTSQILGNNECFEPFTTNIYTRRTLAGEFIILNKYLLAELMELGLWSEAMKQQIVARNGSVQGIDSIPAEVQERYKTSWELKQRTLIDMAAARGAFIDQSQSLNLFVADPTYSKLTSMHFYGWKAGLKTGCYYLRTKTPVTAQKFTVDPRLLASIAGGTSVEPEPEDDAFSLSSDDEETPAPAPTLAVPDKNALKKALLDRLAAEYEASNDGCVMCGS